MNVKPLNKESSEPLYEQLATVLRQDISNFSVGSKFYTDRELCGKFKVSQPVVRSALSILAKEGFIKRVTSKGTFIESRENRQQDPKNLKIGIICPLEPYMPQISAIRSIQECLTLKNCECTVIDNHDVKVPDITTVQKTVIDLMHRVDGIIWVSPFITEYQAFNFLNGSTEKLVIINAHVYSHNISCVLADYEEAEYRLTNHLISLGYKKIGFIGGEKGHFATQLRYSGFVKAMEYNQLEIHSKLVYPNSSGSSKEDGYSFTEKILESGMVPEAIVAVTDHMAYGIITALDEHGLKVPEDIAVVGFDDSPLAKQITPKLTTADQPYYELGKSAVKLLLEQLEGTTKSGGKYHIPCSMTIRESCGESLRSK